ncbi:bifunctional DNA primase/polymerase [Streptomyces sp. NPDC059802]|uniref:bifunctional DNA primase/polymerase n=1 Tax=Streptomyces sp. NPDC059802 TaxID=3346952 RepID=UPI00364BCD1E
MTSTVDALGDQRTPRPDPERVARWCAAQQWPVFPLAPGRKIPMPGCRRCRHNSPAYEPHPARGCPCLANGGWCHGFYAGTLDPALIARWWSDPRRGVAVATGPARLVVIDVDRHTTTPPEDPETALLPGLTLAPAQAASVRDGVDVLRLLARHHRQDDPVAGELTLTVRTPSEGIHLWFRAPARTRWYSSGGGDHRGRRLGWQLDVRADGGLIVAPGTTTACGTYRPIGPVRRPALLPVWLATALTATGHLADEPPPTAQEVKVPNRARAAAAGVPDQHPARDRQGWAQQSAATVLEAVAECGRVSEGAGWSAAVNRAAYTLGGLVAGGHIPQPAAHAALLEAALGARPHKESAALSIIRSGLAAGTRRALHPKDER